MTMLTRLPGHMLLYLYSDWLEAKALVFLGLVLHKHVDRESGYDAILANECFRNASFDTALLSHELKASGYIWQGLNWMQWKLNKTNLHVSVAITSNLCRQRLRLGPMKSYAEYGFVRDVYLFKNGGSDILDTIATNLVQFFPNVERLLIFTPIKMQKLLAFYERMCLSSKLRSLVFTLTSGPSTLICKFLDRLHRSSSIDALSFDDETTACLLAKELPNVRPNIKYVDFGGGFKGEEMNSLIRRYRDCAELREFGVSNCWYTVNMIADQDNTFMEWTTTCLQSLRVPDINLGCNTVLSLLAKFPLLRCIVAYDMKSDLTLLYKENRGEADYNRSWANKLGYNNAATFSQLLAMIPPIKYLKLFSDYMGNFSFDFGTLCSNPSYYSSINTLYITTELCLVRSFQSTQCEQLRYREKFATSDKCPFFIYETEW